MTSKIKTSYIPEISSFLFGRSKPGMVTVNLTNRCNQNCIYCEIGKNIPSSSDGSLDFEDLQWIIDEMAIHKISKISLCGGEPFLFEQIIDVVAYAGAKNIRCSVTTNGMTAYKLNTNELKVLIDCKTEVNISIDSFDENIQSITRGVHFSLPNALKTIQKLIENNIPVTILTAISKYNFSDLFNFTKTAYDKGIKQVLFQPIIYYSNYPDRTAIENKSKLNVGIDKLDILVKELEKILKFEQKHDVRTNVYRIVPWIQAYIQAAHRLNGNWFFYDVLNKFYCREIYAIIDISYDGGIQPCGLAMAKINIHENRQLGLMALWKKATEEIKSNMAGDKYYDFCNGCCHHFSRNMLASIMKYPISNRVALYKVLRALVIRNLSLNINK
jgi:MoaA/NifB/PqqE/SkfB family radical SAM enzyme